MVGGGAAYAPDGLWFAFAARPADGSAGPDIYVWRVGDPRALAVTTDHRSVFSGWFGNQVLGSRVEASSAGPERPAGSNAPAASQMAPSARLSGRPAAGEAQAVSFLLDPVTRERRDLDVPYFRPVVDAKGQWVVYWEGTLAPSPDSREWRPATGRLVVAPWTIALGPAGPALAGSPPPVTSPAASASAAPGRIAPTASPAGSASTPAGSASMPPGSASAPARSSSVPSIALGQGSAAPSSGSGPASSGSSAVPDLRQEIQPGPLADFDAQFDPTGTHLAVWTASQADRSTGFLSLYILRAGAWSLDPDRRLVAAPALRGFAIGQGELAWVTPPGADGHGSHVAVLGWTADGVGSVESVPGDSLLVIR